MNPDVRVDCFVEPSFGENAYVVWLRDGGACWIVDPGLPPSAARILAHVRQHRVQPDAIVLTHGHADHIAGIPEILTAFPGLPVFLADTEASMLSNPNHNLSAALGAAVIADVGDRRDLTPGATLTLDGSNWRVLDVAGHSPGGRALYCADAGVVIVGDALFDGGIGRTDFPTSDHGTLVNNIHRNLFVLPDSTRVFSGHGAPTQIGRERRTNPFVGEMA